MELCIIIVNYNHSHLLKSALQSVYLATQNIHFEIILIDNSFQDEGLESVLNQFPEIRLIDNTTNLWFACANNQGAGMAKGDFLLFLNPDTTMKEGTIETMLGHLRANPSVGVVGPKVLNLNGTIQYSCRKFPTIWSGRWPWIQCKASGRRSQLIIGLAGRELLFRLTCKKLFDLRKN